MRTVPDWRGNARRPVETAAAISRHFRCFLWW